MKKKKDERLVASLVIHGVGDMSYGERLDIYAWLGGQGESVMYEGRNYPELFTARYYVPVGNRRGKKKVLEHISKPNCKHGNTRG